MIHFDIFQLAEPPFGQRVMDKERERKRGKERKKKQLENMKAADGRRRNGRKSMKMADKGSGLNMYFTV